MSAFAIAPHHRPPIIYRADDESWQIGPSEPFFPRPAKRRICFEWPAGADGPENVEIVDYDWQLLGAHGKRLYLTADPT